MRFEITPDLLEDNPFMSQADTVNCMCNVSYPNVHLGHRQTVWKVCVTCLENKQHSDLPCISSLSANFMD
jgi:hypothetical protein